MSPRLVLWFILSQMLAGGFVFRDALWGRSLLAPLDLPPALFSKFRYIDPASDGVPANHHIMDQITYDLPLQWTVYQAYQRGETPWWDPYTYCGRPLLADAHTSASDPIRWMVFHLLPFELAYNWTRIIHYGLFGFGMVLLLRSLGFKESTSLWLALACEFSSGFAFFFGHPWVQASFAYYPFLWVAWSSGLEGKRWTPIAAPLLIAAIFYAGNLQSHAYLAVFALCFGLGYAGLEWRKWVRLTLLQGATLVLGAMLAAPVLSAELELFALNTREVRSPFHPLGWLGGLGATSAFYPWSLGTFRTLDLSKLIGRNWHLGFSVFIGCAAFWLSCIGSFGRDESTSHSAPRRTALWLVASYLFITSTPLNEYLYTRCAPLALIGLTVLAAFGWESILRNPAPFRRLGWTVLAMTITVGLATNLFAALVYPRLIPQVERFVTKSATTNKNLDEAKALRASQITRLPSEISFRNPETVFGFLGMLSMAALLLWPRFRSQPMAGTLLFLLNLLPLLLFSARFIPRHPLEFWARLREGGPEQQRLMADLQGTPLRLLEEAPGTHEQALPLAFANLYRLRIVHGYAALRPFNPSIVPPAELSRWRIADRIYESKVRGLPAGELRTNATSGYVRFQWAPAQSRRFSVSETNLNRIQLQFEPGPAGTLVWADTRYPGWSAHVDGALVELLPAEPCFSAVEISTSGRTLELSYEPRFLKLGKILAGLAGFALVMLSLKAWSEKRQLKVRAG